MPRLAELPPPLPPAPAPAAPASSASNAPASSAFSPSPPPPYSSCAPTAASPPPTTAAAPTPRRTPRIAPRSPPPCPPRPAPSSPSSPPCSRPRPRRPPAELRLRLPSPDGQRVWRVTGAHLDERPAPLALLSFDDITAETVAREDAEALGRRLDALVRERTARLEEANQLLMSYAVFVAHDLRSPLSAVKGYLSLLTPDQSRIPPTASTTRARPPPPPA